MVDTTDVRRPVAGPPAVGQTFEDRARRLLVERDLVRTAFDHLTVDAFMTLAFESLGPTKALLKRFFSDGPWTAADDEALADIVGPGEGEWQRHLDADLTLEYGWTAGRFYVRVASTVAGGSEPAIPPDAGLEAVGASSPLAASFDGPVVPEATPNPRTIRFQVGTIHGGPSRWYESVAGTDDDAGVHRLFTDFAEVADVLVGPDFVAVGLRRADDWERLLLPVLAVVTDEFAPADGGGEAGGDGGGRVMGGPAGAGAAGIGERKGAPGGTAAGSDPGRRLSRLEQAWHDLGALRPAEGGDLDRLREAALGPDPARRQVAANLLREADADAAASEWTRLVADPVRSVRRAAVDAMADVAREGLRPLLEAALADRDPWVRWKALRGLAQLGARPSRAAVVARADDTDFRVRLEVAAVLRSI